jgi:hypothetical protein
MLQANSIKALSREACGPVLTEQDIQNIRQLGQRGDSFELISASLAPSVSPLTTLLFSLNDSFIPTDIRSRIHKEELAPAPAGRC